MKRFNLLYEQILENMSRRGFLKMLGKGAQVAAANNLIPGGVVGTALKGVMNATQVASQGINLSPLKLAIYNHYKTFTGEHAGYLLDLNGDIQRGTMSTLLKTLGQYKIPLDSFTAGQMKLWSQTSDYNNIPPGLETGAVDIAHMLLNDLAKAKVGEAKIVPDEVYKMVEKEFGWERANFENPSNNQQQKNKEQPSDGIKYSRSDYAGGSEDEGYAKYYENYLKENYADGKNPGRKGLAKRSGVNTKASVSSLRKTAKNSTGEKARMAHWMANMKAGKKKAKK